ncbi:MAG: hypothetical protein KGN16_07785 [Burkholderiales bacterium]|nr:hypothetical protein [Burkholderiales bacterium]
MALCLCLFALGSQAQDKDAVVLIANPSVPHLDLATVQRLYTGRAVEVGGNAVVVVNAAPGSPLRERFMATVLKQSDEQYIAYWTVRKHIGKGTPPVELKSSAEIIAFVLGMPGGVGYIAASDLRPGMNVVLRP